VPTSERESPTLIRGLAVALIAWVIAAAGGAQIRTALQRGNQLSEIADSYSEADALRSAEGYEVKGFFADAGLPDIAYGNQFPKDGVKPHKDWCPPGKPCIYTHYPPGPNWVAGMLRIVFHGNLAAMRLFPILVTLLAMAYLAASLVEAMGPVRAAGAMLIFGGVPMFTNMAHGLHYQSYAFALQLAELGILARLFARPAGARIPTGLWVGLGLIAFFQGWMDFDYAFMTVFAPLPFALLAPRLDGRRLVLAVLVAGGGFTFAHLLHVVQLVVYFGQFDRAIGELRGSAGFRYNFVPLEAWCQTSIGGLTGLVMDYLFIQAPADRYLGVDMMARAVLVSVLVLVPRGRLGGLTLTAPRRAHLALLAAFLISVLWIVIMQNHAACHRHFLPRHLFFFYFFIVFVGLSALGSVAAVGSSFEETGDGG